MKFDHTKDDMFEAAGVTNRGWVEEKFLHIAADVVSSMLAEEDDEVVYEQGSEVAEKLYDTFTKETLAVLLANSVLSTAEEAAEATIKQRQAKSELVSLIKSLFE